MSGLKETTSEKIIYVNIKEGKLVVRLPDKTLKEYASLEGVIRKVLFVNEEYDGKKFEKAKFYINAIGETHILQMRIDSGYFRGFCNSLRSSSYPTEILEITPHFNKADGKTKTTCFVKQNGVTLKHFFTKNNMGDLPSLEIHEFKGQPMYDNVKQIEYWKNWLNQTFPETTEEQNSKQSKLDFDSEPLLDDMPF
jgi:hypothetical protein